ncbi:MAG TPA: PHP domain-containing protein [Candidatus Scatomonas merdavium]|nr:PHP domain-containing protein [Candidatus Scatomonas merdavium]
MKFDMHCHTKEGSLDGKVVIEEYIRRLKEKGFGGMLVSDHNSYDGYREWKNSLKGKAHTDFVVLKGVEYDTLDCGHMLIIMPTGMKLRILEMRGLPIVVLMKIVHHYGGIIGPAHPYGEKYLSVVTTRERKERKYSKNGNRKLIEQFDFIEIFNACESPESNRKAARLAQKYGCPGFGGSDAHKLDCIGKGWADLPDTIRSENDLIAYVKGKPQIRCGGSFYEKTVKEKLGKLNVVRLDGFFFFNKLGAASRRRKRKKELKRIFPEYKEAKKHPEDFQENPEEFPGIQN